MPSLRRIALLLLAVGAAACEQDQSVTGPRPGAVGHRTSNPVNMAVPAVGAGSAYSCGLRSSGALVCCGNDFFGVQFAPAGVFKQFDAGDKPDVR